MSITRTAHRRCCQNRIGAAGRRHRANYAKARRMTKIVRLIEDGDVDLPKRDSRGRFLSIRKITTSLVERVSKLLRNRRSEHVGQLTPTTA